MLPVRIHSDGKIKSLGGRITHACLNGAPGAQLTGQRNDNGARSPCFGHGGVGAGVGARVGTGDGAAVGANVGGVGTGEGADVGSKVGGHFWNNLSVHSVPRGLQPHLAEHTPTFTSLQSSMPVATAHEVNDERASREAGIVPVRQLFVTELREERGWE